MTSFSTGAAGPEIGQNLQIRLVGFAVQTLYDNIALDATSNVAIPEPSSAALLCLGGLALVLRRRK